jgi:multisubunit Na+/H+ antiporter MnhG subunit
MVTSKLISVGVIFIALESDNEKATATAVSEAVVVATATALCATAVLALISPVRVHVLAPAACENTRFPSHAPALVQETLKRFTLMEKSKTKSNVSSEEVGHGPWWYSMSPPAHSTAAT